MSEIDHLVGVHRLGPPERSTSAMSAGRIAVPLLQSSPSLKRPSSSAAAYMTSPELMERRQVRATTDYLNTYFRMFDQLQSFSCKIVKHQVF